MTVKVTYTVNNLTTENALNKSQFFTKIEKKNK